MTQIRLPAVVVAYSTVFDRNIGKFEEIFPTSPLEIIQCIFLNFCTSNVKNWDICKYFQIFTPNYPHIFPATSPTCLQHNESLCIFKMSKKRNDTYLQTHWGYVGLMLRKNVGKKCGDDFKMKFQIIQKRPNCFMLLVLKFKNTLKRFDVGM